MIQLLQQFYKALTETMIACRHKTQELYNLDETVATLTEQLRTMIGERDVLVAEQKEAMKMIDEMTIELNKK